MLSHAILNLTLLAAAPSLAIAVEATTPPEALTQFFAALTARDIDRAVAMTAYSKQLPSEEVREFYQRIADREGPAFEVVGHLQLANTAVVVISEGNRGTKGRVDLDPAFMVKHGDAWQVFFKLTKFDRPEVDLDEITAARFKKLQSWFERQKESLKSAVVE